MVLVMVVLLLVHHPCMPVVVVGVTHMHILLLIRITHTKKNIKKNTHLVLLEQHPQQLQCM